MDVTSVARGLLGVVTVLGIAFAGLIAVLYHLRVMQIVTRYLGGGIAKLLGTSRADARLVHRARSSLAA